MNSPGKNPVSQDEVEFTELVISNIEDNEMSSLASGEDGKVSVVQQPGIEVSSSLLLNSEIISKDLHLKANYELQNTTSSNVLVANCAENSVDSIAHEVEPASMANKDPKCTSSGALVNNNEKSPIVIKVSTRGSIPNSMASKSERVANNLAHNDSLQSRVQSNMSENGLHNSECSSVSVKESDAISGSHSTQVTQEEGQVLGEIVENMSTNMSEAEATCPMDTREKTLNSKNVDLTVENDDTDPEIIVLENESSQKQQYREQILLSDSNDEEWSSDSEPDSSASESEDSEESSSDESASTSSEKEKTITKGKEEKGTETRNCDTNTTPTPTEETSQKVRKKKAQKGTKHPNELTLEDLTKIEDLQISVPEEEAESIGVISSIVNQLVVVQSHPNLRAVDLGSILFLKQGSEALGEIFDVMGCVDRPYYVVRFNSRLHITERGIDVGQEVFSAPRTNHCTFVDVEALMTQPGSDASWEHDREPPENFIEYSDDEAEQSSRRAKKNRRKNEESFTIKPDNCLKRPRSDNYFARSSGAPGGCAPVHFTGQPTAGGWQGPRRTSFGNPAFNGVNHNWGSGNSNFNQRSNGNHNSGNPMFGSNFPPPPMRGNHFDPPPRFQAPPSFTGPPSVATPPPRLLPPPPPSPNFSAPPPATNAPTSSPSPLPWAPSSNSSHYNMSQPPPPPGEPIPPVPFSVTAPPPPSSVFGAPPPSPMNMTNPSSSQLSWAPSSNSSHYNTSQPPPPPGSQYFSSNQRFSSVFGQPPRHAPPPPHAAQGAPGGSTWAGAGSGCVTNKFSNPWSEPPPSYQSYSNSSHSSNQVASQFPSVPFNAMNPPPQPPTRPY